LGGSNALSFIEGLWDSDGTVYVGVQKAGTRIYRIAYTAKDLLLTEDVSRLLQQFGFIPKITKSVRRDGGEQYALVVNGYDYGRFKLLFSLQEKKQKILDLVPEKMRRKRS